MLRQTGDIIADTVCWHTLCYITAMINAISNNNKESETMSNKVIISKGNSKIGKIPNVSLRPILDCGNCKSCAGDCYARKAYAMYPAVRSAWGNNGKVFRANPATACQQVSEYVAKHKPEFFRWNVSGDILNQAHMDGIRKTAIDNPGTKFLVFTKMHGLSFRNIPANLKVILSMFPTMPKHGKKFSSAWMQDGTETRIPKTAWHCPGSCLNCGACWNLKNGQDVYFTKH